MNHSIDHSHQDSDLFGLLYGFRFRPGEKGEQIDSATALQALQQPQDPQEFLWLHLNLAHAGCERWMLAHLQLPEEFFEALHEGSRSTRIEHVDSALLAVVNDVVFNFSSMVSSDISTLWVCARSHLLISARGMRTKTWTTRGGSSCTHTQTGFVQLRFTSSLACVSEPRFASWGTQPRTH